LHAPTPCDRPQWSDLWRTVEPVSAIDWLAHRKIRDLW
jgi:hypothetical protein